MCRFLWDWTRPSWLNWFDGLIRPSNLFTCVKHKYYATCALASLGTIRTAGLGPQQRHTSKLICQQTKMATTNPTLLRQYQKLSVMRIQICWVYFCLVNFHLFFQNNFQNNPSNKNRTGRFRFALLNPLVLRSQVFYILNVYKMGIS